MDVVEVETVCGRSVPPPRPVTVLSHSNLFFELLLFKWTKPSEKQFVSYLSKPHTSERYNLQLMPKIVPQINLVQQSKHCILDNVSKIFDVI